MREDYRNAVDRIALTDGKKAALYHQIRLTATPHKNPDAKGRMRWGKRKLVWMAAAALSLVLVAAITINSIPVAAAIATPSYPSEEETAYAMADDGYLDALRRFSYQTAGKVERGADGNTVYSPYSMSVVLSMLAQCTDGETREEILHAFGLDTLAQLSEGTAGLYRLLYRDTEEYLCRSVQSVWLDSSLSYNQDVLQSLAEDEYAYSYRMPFEDGRAASAVSDWFSENMKNGRNISVPFIPGNKLMFASGFAFRSEWEEIFIKEQTYEGVFSGTSITGNCEYMNKVAAAVPYLQTEKATASLIGLSGGSSLILILPQEGKELDDILSDGALLQDIVSRTLHAEKTSVEFSIPKVSFEETIDISSVFGQMGIVSAFDETKADFSALSSDTGVFAGQIAESAVLDLNKNIETAIGEKAYGSSSGSMYSLHLNRPFCFIIVSQNEIPLMIGAVENVMQLEE